MTDSDEREETAVEFLASHRADLTGKNGMRAMRLADQRLAELNGQAEPQIKPDHVQQLEKDFHDLTGSNGTASRAAAEERLNPPDPETEPDYRFQWDPGTPVETATEMNEIASGAAAALGADPREAADFVQVANRAAAAAANKPIDENGGEALANELIRQHGPDRANDILTDARTALEKVDPRARDWLLNLIDRVPAGSAAWMIAELARHAR